MLDEHDKPYGQRARGMRAVLIGVADAANADGEHAHPGLANLAAFSLYSRRQVQTTLALLVAEGWLSIVEQGGGKGKATEFALPLMAETVQSLHSFADRNGAVSPAKGCSGAAHTVQSASDTAHSGLHPNVLATTDTTKPSTSAAAPPAKATDDPVKRHAHALTVLAFEQPEKPVVRGDGAAGFPATMAIFERLLRAGQPVQGLRTAIEGGYVTVWTVAGIQTAIAQARGRPRTSRSKQAVADAARSMGLDPAQVDADADDMVRAMFSDSGLKSGVIDTTGRD